MSSVFVPWAVGPQVGLFGKVPTAGDFAHLRIGDDQKLCEWLQRGVERASAKLGSRWSATFDAGAPFGFMMRQTSGSVLGGVMRPSRDAVGRRFPLVGYASLSSTDAPNVRHLVPWALTTFAQSLCALVSSAEGVGMDPVETIRNISVQAVPGEQGEAHYNDWLRATPASAWFEAVWRRKDAELAKYAVAMIVSSVGPYAGQDNSQNPLALRLPVAGDLRGAAFWLELVARLGAWRATVPTVFWEVLQPATVLIQLGEARPSSYVELWSRGSDDEHVVDLCSLGNVNSDAFIGAVPPALVQKLGEDSASLWDVLGAAGARG
jgi:type VI secretion system ImpM family protein